ncbi:unnamed protein product [Cochlearia groenlandica]
MSASLNVCKICGKEFLTAKAVYGHKRIHNGKDNRVEDDDVLQRNWDQKESRVCSVSSFAKEVSIESETFDPLQGVHKGSSFMSATEQDEMYEAAISLVMFSEQVAVTRDLTQADIAIDLELKSMPEKSLHCVVESKQEFSEVFPHSGFEKSSTCSDVVVAQALPSPMKSKMQKKPLSKCSYKCKICGKSFECSRTLGGHQTLHRSDRERLARKRAFEDCNSLSGLSEDKKIVSYPSSFEVSQEEVIEQTDANVKKHCIESKQDFSEGFSHTGFEKYGTCNDVSSQALPPMRSKSQKEPERKRFECSRALGGHRKLCIWFRGKLVGKKKDLEDGSSLLGSSESMKL